MLFKGTNATIKEALKKIGQPGDVPIYEYPFTEKYIDGDKSIVVGESISPDQVLQVFVQNQCSHLVQVENSSFEKSIVTAGAILKNPEHFIKNPLKFILGEEVFGKIKEDPANCFQRSIEGKESKEEIIDEFRGYIKGVPKMATIRDSSLLVLDELLMNVIYDAPKYSDGKNLLPVNGGEIKNQFFCAYWEDRLFLGTQDQYGSLSTNKLMSRLHETYQSDQVTVNMNQDQGAGVGCRLMYDLSTEFYVAVQPGRATVVLSALPLGLSYRKQQQMPKNLHVVKI